MTDYSKIAEELKKHILTKKDLPTEEVEVPEWELPYPIYVRTMSAAEKDEFETEQFISNAGDDVKDDKDAAFKASLQNLRAATLARVLCADPEGEYRIFTDLSDIIALGKKSAAAIDRCLEVTKRLNGITQEDEKNLLKNSQGRDDSSG